MSINIMILSYQYLLDSSRRSTDNVFCYLAYCSAVAD